MNPESSLVRHQFGIFFETTMFQPNIHNPIDLQFTACDNDFSVAIFGRVVMEFRSPDRPDGRIVSHG